MSHLCGSGIACIPRQKEGAINIIVVLALALLLGSADAATPPRGAFETVKSFIVRCENDRDGVVVATLAEDQAHVRYSCVKFRTQVLDALE